MKRIVSLLAFYIAAVVVSSPPEPKTNVSGEFHGTGHGAFKDKNDTRGSNRR